MCYATVHGVSLRVGYAVYLKKGYTLLVYARTPSMHSAIAVGPIIMYILRDLLLLIQHVQIDQPHVEQI